MRSVIWSTIHGFYEGGISDTMHVDIADNVTAKCLNNKTLPLKSRLLFLLVFFSSLAFSDEGNETDVENEEPKKGDTIWLEEKINPTTTWIESLVKPLTEWMEGQIQEPEPQVEDQVGSSPVEELNTPSIQESGNQQLENSHQNQLRITEEQAKEFAGNHVAGEVLYIKFVPKANAYRVKLISMIGEVRVVYIEAVSGQLVSSNGKRLNKSLEQPAKGKGNSPDSISPSEDFKRESS